MADFKRTTVAGLRNWCVALESVIDCLTLQSKEGTTSQVFRGLHPFLRQKTPVQSTWVMGDPIQCLARNSSTAALHAGTAP